jgi:acetylornithine deacetylase/succinyl-diaminopimelate desuccinylase-like protein
MKSGLAAMVYAIAALRDADISLNGRVGLVIVPDEETGGRRGSHYLAEAGLLGQDGVGMLTPEPTSGVVWHANRGAITLRVTVKGKPAHVGLQHEGVNAFDHMLIVAEALRDLKAEVEGRVSAFALEPEAARHSILMMGGRCEGGTNFNVVPAECSFTVERRINPEEDLQAEKARLFDVLDRARSDGIDLDVEILQEAPSSGSAADSPLALAITDSIVAETGRTPAFEMCPGLLEIRFYAQRDMPAYAYGPGLLSVSHGPEEYVEVDKIAACAAIYARTALRLLSA